MKYDRISNQNWPTDEAAIDRIERWLLAEEEAIASSQNIPDTSPLTEGWPYDPKTTNGDTVGLLMIGAEDRTIPGQSPRLFDAAIVAFLRLALLAGDGSACRVYNRLDATRREEEGGGQFYPKLFLSASSADVKSKTLPIARIVLDAPKYRHAMMASGDFYDFRTRNLMSKAPRPDFKPGHQTQDSAVTDIMDTFDCCWRYGEAPIDRERLKKMLYMALGVARKREVLRRAGDIAAA